MQIIQSRRDFLASLSAAGAAGVLGGRGSLADEGPPETTTIRIRVEDAPPLMVTGCENALCTRPLHHRGAAAARKASPTSAMSS